MKQRTIAGLDIGTHSIKLVIARELESGELEIAGAGEELSSGVRNGVITNPTEVEKHISVLCRRVEQMSGVSVDTVVANIGGSHIFVTPSHGIVAVSRADGNISPEDVERVLQAAEALSLDANKTILEIVPRQFIVDGVENLREVVSMKGVRLEVDVLAVCAFAPYVRNVEEAITGAGLSVNSIVPSSLASGFAILSPQQKELGVGIIDIGAATTSLAVYEEGNLLHASVFPIGSKHITNDIAIGLKIEPDVAEMIKLEYGSLGLKGRKMQKINLADGTQISFQQKFLSRIIEARVKEIFGLIDKDLKAISKQAKLPAGIVLVGGGAKLPHIEEFAKKELKLSAKLGSPQDTIGYPENLSFSGALGLVTYGKNGRNGTMPGFSNFGLWEPLKKLFRMFIP